MKDPCEICMDKDRCGGSQPCSTKKAYIKYKKKCKEIAEHTKKVMQRAKEKQKSKPEPAWKEKMMDDFMKGVERRSHDRTSSQDTATKIF